MASQTPSRPRKGVRFPAPDAPAQELPAAPDTGTVSAIPADPRMTEHKIPVGDSHVLLGVIVH